MRLVLASAEFEASPKLSELLYYLVTETLAGNSERLKGYTIGVDVFDRQHDFDQGVDAIVRVQMGRLRKLLKSYYDNSGATDPIRILLIAGRYAPRFELATGEELSDEELGEPYSAGGFVAPPLPPEEEGPGGILGTRKGRTLVLGLVLLLLAGLAGTGLYVAYHQAAPAIDPATERDQGPLVYVSQYRVIGKSDLAGQLAQGLQYDLVNQLAKFTGIAVLGIDTVSGNGFNEASRQASRCRFRAGRCDRGQWRHGPHHQPVEADEHRPHHLVGSGDGRQRPAGDDHLRPGRHRLERCQQDRTDLRGHHPGPWRSRYRRWRTLRSTIIAA